MIRIRKAKRGKGTAGRRGGGRQERGRRNNWSTIVLRPRRRLPLAWATSPMMKTWALITMSANYKRDVSELEADLTDLVDILRGIER